MIAILISLLLQIGAISSAAEYDNLSTEQQQQYMENYQDQIIIEDLGQI